MILRFIAYDISAYGIADVDADGTWDIWMIGNTATLPTRSGPIGIQGYAGVYIDDVKFFSAVLRQDAAVPRAPLGNRYRMRMRATPNKTYQAACSWTNNGIPVGGGMWIPLWIDPLFFVSANNVFPTIFVNFAGQMDANGDAEAGVEISDDVRAQIQV